MQPCRWCVFGLVNPDGGVEFIGYGLAADPVRALRGAPGVYRELLARLDAGALTVRILIGGAVPVSPDYSCGYRPSRGFTVSLEFGGSWREGGLMK